MRYAFGNCVLDTQRIVLYRAGQAIHLRPKVFHLLMFLLGHRDRVISKDELCHAIWPEQFISDATLESAMRALRQAIGDSGREQRFIQTLHGHGYRFVATVAEQAEVMAEETSCGAALTPVEVDGALDAPTSLREPVGSLLQEAVSRAATDAQAEPYVPCPHCYTEQPVTARFCEQCGAPLGRVCPGCGAMVGTLVRFCSACGTGLSTPSLTADRMAPDPSRAPGVERASQRVPPTPATRGAVAERRQLTVLCCDLVASTALAARLDPEAFREVLRAYHAACATVIERFDGHIAQYLGSGLLVYFGYPLAHEDAPQRAVRTGLGIVEAVRSLSKQSQVPGGFELVVPLQVRVGIHTGLVVIDEVGDGARQEWLALGEVPNLATGLQSLAAPETVVTSAATWRLVEGWFVCQPLGGQTLAGLPQPVAVYRVLQESGAQSRIEVTGARGLTPLIGREPEVALLQERWAQVKDGLGQVVLLSGEAGIGKSRLVQVLKAHIADEPHFRWEWRCTPITQHTALYPVIDLFRRMLHFQGDEAPEAQRKKIEAALAPYDVSLTEMVPLLASLLSIPLGDAYPPLTLMPEQHKQQTLAALLALLLAMAAQRPVLCIMEDLHWADPSTLELLMLLLDQVPATRLLTILVFRPEFRPPWDARMHLSQLTLTRLTRHQAELMVARVAGGKTLPPEVLRQVVTQTDGVPLFVEEWTKMVLESGWLQEHEDRYELAGPLPPVPIPATLSDLLMTRLDRLATAKTVAQLAAVIGRQFSYELLHTVSPMDEAVLQQALGQLVEAQLLYQRGLIPQVTYTFKHALIQEAAYQTLVRNTRQDYHQRIAQVLVEQFPETVEAQPELLAYHYTQAGLYELAINYWQRAGQHAVERSANAEAISHCTKGLELLKTLLVTPKLIDQELILQATLGSALIASKGYASSDVEYTYRRARELCQQGGETLQLFRVMRGLCLFYMNRGELQTAREIGGQLLRLAQHLQDPICLVEAHRLLGAILHWLGELRPAREHLEQGMAFYDTQQHRSYLALYGQDPGVACLSYLAWTLWCLGYPNQALESIDKALALSQTHLHDFSWVFALDYAAVLHQCRREEQTAQERVEKVIALAQEHGFSFWRSEGMILQGYGRIKQGQCAEGIAQMHQGLAAHRATGTELARPSFLALLAEGYGEGGQVEEALTVLDEALTAVQQTGECWWEAELYRLRGELGLLQAVGAKNPGTGPMKTAMRAETKGGSTDRSFLTPNVETYFHKALTIARRQHAKSLELRAAMSLARLWQRQGKRAEAHQLLAEVYSWFTEGFDTADLQEANALLAELACP